VDFYLASDRFLLPPRGVVLLPPDCRQEAFTKHWLPRMTITPKPVEWAAMRSYAIPVDALQRRRVGTGTVQRIKQEMRKPERKLRLPRLSAPDQSVPSSHPFQVVR